HKAMPSFQYKARSAVAELVQGTLNAASVDAVLADLLKRGNTPIDINEEKASLSSMDIGQMLARNKGFDLSDLILFSRQMHTLIKAGVPMVRSLTGLIETSRNFRMGEALQDILAHVESGQNLSTAFAAHPDIFPQLFISMIRVGENTGGLDETFLRMAIHMDREKETKDRIKEALRYPTLVFIAIAVAIGVINVMVIPVFAEMFEKSGVALPWQTQVLISTSNFFVAWWPVILILLGGAFTGFTQWTKTDQGGYQWDKIKLDLPIAGDIIHKGTLARFSRSLSMALAAGVPVLNALNVVSGAVDNNYVTERIQSMLDGIERGESITHTARQTGMFTPLVIQMISVGEETGSIDVMLAEVAEYYEREVDYDIKNLSAAIEPIVIIFIGFMVLTLALGVFLPMWDMSTIL
ncbi:MAG: type II secretion system F family protein, partial [Gammaproteobacteria bacterium]|nr:type II secretion system F family protein [Gammaproteobacteria bacterium]